MNYKAHMASSLALGAGMAATTVAPCSFTVTYALGITLGSILPDIDEPTSIIGKHSFGLARIIKRHFGHRGITHSLFAWGLLTLVCFNQPTDFFIGISLGYLFHIIGDFFSVASVPLFLPFHKFRLRNMPFAYRADGKAEKLIEFLSIVSLLYCILAYRLYVPFIQSVFEWLQKILSLLL